MHENLPKEGQIWGRDVSKSPKAEALVPQSWPWLLKTTHTHTSRPEVLRHSYSLGDISYSPDLNYDLQVDDTLIHLSHHLWLCRFLPACEIIPKARQSEPWVHFLSPKLPFLSGSPLLLDPQAWKSSSDSSSSSLSLSHTNPPSRTLHKHAQVWPLAPTHIKLPLTLCSLHFHLLSLRSTNNIPQILLSITSLLWSWLRLSSIPQIKSQFLTWVKVFG